MKIDVPLAWISRRTRVLPGARRATWILRKHFARRYRNSAERWATIDDFDGDLKFRLNRASYMGSAIYWGGCNSIDEVSLVRRLVTPDSVFIDVGAHSGEFTLVAAK